MKFTAYELSIILRCLKGSKKYLEKNIASGFYMYHQELKEVDALMERLEAALLQE
jgi:hypothetical protein